MDSWELWSTRFSYTAQGGSAWKRLLTVAWWNEWRSGGRCCVLRHASKQHSGTKECHYEDYSSATWSADQPHHRPTKGHLKRRKTETVQISAGSKRCMRCSSPTRDHRCQVAKTVSTRSARSQPPQMPYWMNKVRINMTAAASLFRLKILKNNPLEQDLQQVSQSCLPL